MILYLTVKPNAKKDELYIDESNKFLVKIKAPPVDGKANKYLIKFLSEIFDLPKSSMQILSGLNNPHKKIEIAGDETILKNILEKYRK